MTDQIQILQLNISTAGSILYMSTWNTKTCGNVAVAGPILQCVFSVSVLHYNVVVTL